MTLVPKTRPRTVPPPAAVPRRFLVLGSAAVCIAILLFVMFAVFYRVHAHHGAARAAARLLPLPVARVEGRVVWYRELSARANALEALAGVAPSEAVDRALARAERDAMVAEIAEELGVTVSEEEVEAFAADDAELRQLVDVAGWTESEYRNFGVARYLLAEKTELALLSSSTYQASARGRMEKILVKLGEGIPFSDLALHYSEGVDLSSAPVDATPGVIETATSFWLLTSDAGIEIKKDLLGEIVTSALATADVSVWLR